MFTVCLKYIFIEKISSIQLTNNLGFLAQCKKSSSSNLSIIYTICIHLSIEFFCYRQSLQQNRHKRILEMMMEAVVFVFLCSFELLLLVHARTQSRLNTTVVESKDFNHSFSCNFIYMQTSFFISPFSFFFSLSRFQRLLKFSFLQ